MAGATAYPSAIKGAGLRLTRLDECGVPLSEVTANSRLTTAGFVMMTLEPDFDETPEILVKTADSVVAGHEASSMTPKGFKGKLKVAGVAPEVLEMTINAGLLTDSDSNVRGMTSPSSDDAPNYLALQTWSRTTRRGACSSGAFPFFEWNLAGCDKWALTGELLWDEESATEFELSFYCSENPNWAPSIAADLETAAGDAPTATTWTTALQGAGGLSVHSVASLPTIAAAAGYDS